MANLVSSLFVQLTANTASFQSSMQKAERRVHSAAKQMDKATSSIKQLAGAFGAGISIAVFTRMANNAIQAGSAITDMAISTRTGVEELQALTFAAREAGASNEQMANLLVRANKSANDAARGLSTASDAFEQLGIDAKAFLDLPSERKIEEIGKAIVRSKGDVRAYGSALDLLGTRNAPKLMEVLERLGTEGFDSVADAARKAGQVMNEQMAQRMDKTADRLEEFKTRMTNISAAVVSSIMDISDALGTLAATAIYGDGDKVLREFAESQLRSEGAFDDLRGRGSAAKKAKMVAQRMEEIQREETDAQIRYNRERNRKAALTPPTTDSPDIVPPSGDVEAFLSGMAEIEKGMEGIKKASTEATAVNLKFANLSGPLKDLAFEGFGSVKTAVDNAREEVSGWHTEIASGITTMAGALESGLVNAAQNGKAAFGDMAEFILVEIQRILIRSLLLRPLFDFIGGLFPTGNVIGEAFTGAFGGGKSAGGPVHEGVTYRVGEHGPEELHMGSGGYITQASASRGGPIFNVDMRGASVEAVARLERFVAQVNGSIEQRAVAAVGIERNLNPAY